MLNNEAYLREYHRLNDELMKTWFKMQEFIFSHTEKRPEPAPSKSKPEWEIVSYKNKINGIILTKYDVSGNSYYLNGFDDFTGGFKGQDCFLIHSVKRLSDGEVFTVGDFIIPHQLEYSHPIISFGINGNVLYANFTLGNTQNEWNTIIGLRKAPPKPKPLFTTEDGVDKFEYESCYILWEDWSTTSFLVDPAFRKYDNVKYFSSKEAIENWILLNKPCLSVNEASEIFRYSLGMLSKEDGIERLKHIAEQKIQSINNGAK